VRWLRNLGVRYVVQTDSPPDYSARAEDELLSSGRTGLPVVFRSAHETIYLVRNPRPLVTGPAPAHLVSLTESEIRVLVSVPGRYRVAVRYSPYWTAEGSCVEAGGDGLVRLVVKRPGPVGLKFTVGPGRMLKTLVGERHRQCS
jgi:hypothetical protein